MRTYLAIDLKSFYASAECAALGLDPLNANLVVANAARTDKTICLAVSPALKSFGVPGRPRLFEVKATLRKLNRQRRAFNHYESIYRDELLKHPRQQITFKIVPPRMQYYLELSNHIYEIYLRYFQSKDIHVYSIDEVFIDITDYLATHRTSARQVAKQVILAIQTETKITATAGIGENLYLAKVALDIVAKKINGDHDGVRIAQLTTTSYRQLLWAHQPLTDFWRVGRGYAKRLAKLGLHTMGDIARVSVAPLDQPLNPETLYQTFGKNAELLIDHAWGIETATIADIKSYRNHDHGIYSSQVLPRPYHADEAKIVVTEMADDLAYQLMKRRATVQQLALRIDYDPQSLQQPGYDYPGELKTDFYGRQVPKPTQVNLTLPRYTDSARELKRAFAQLYQQAFNQHLLIRKITVIANQLFLETNPNHQTRSEQLDLFAPTPTNDQTTKTDHQLQQVIMKIRDEHGKNAILTGTDLLDGATGKKRHNEIGGHDAWTATN